ncbi:glucose-repressible protein [Penicillium angulare]|uniref:glucose-repressible protein n=1 Tax=Penicillium angulare TaxID=116970 RepID=UPI002540B261|nr:glucose-repressible protein [Penicillium angulare]KAJ5291628.1 glucose-repressible protein [Penicillium angulare]
METVKQAANYVAETVQGSGATAEKEANKTTAKNSDASVTTRAQAAFDAAGNKIDEQKHDVKADVHKEAAKQ